MLYSIGIDIGSRFTKIVFMNQDEVLHKIIKETGLEPIQTVKNVLSKLKQSINIDSAIDELVVCSTGYGRKLLKSSYVSEISCHSKAVSILYPSTSVIIDIGGQDSKVIVLDEQGKVVNFSMNDKCAAGTGSFFERVAQLCKMSITQMSETALKSETEIDISSTCVVFAESEIISLINRNNKIEDVLMSVHYAVARRIINMLPDISVNYDKILQSVDVKIVLTGGVANNKAMVFALEKKIKHQLTVPSEPSFTGALGAAYFALDYPEKFETNYNIFDLEG